MHGHSYVVEKILGHKFERGTLKLEVKWQGYDDPSDRTWETESNLQTAPEAVAEYFDDLGGRPERPGKKKAAAAAARGPGGSAESRASSRRRRAPAPASAAGRRGGRAARPRTRRTVARRAAAAGSTITRA